MGDAPDGKVTKAELEELVKAMNRGSGGDRDDKKQEQEHETGPSPKQQREIMRDLRKALAGSTSGTLTMEETYQTILNYVRNDLKAGAH